MSITLEQSHCISLKCFWWPCHTTAIHAWQWNNFHCSDPRSGIYEQIKKHTEKCSWQRKCLFSFRLRPLFHAWLQQGCGREFRNAYAGSGNKERDVAKPTPPANKGAFDISTPINTYVQPHSGIPGHALRIWSLWLPWNTGSHQAHKKKMEEHEKLISTLPAIVATGRSPKQQGTHIVNTDVHANTDLEAKHCTLQNPPCQTPNLPWHPKQHWVLQSVVNGHWISDPLDHNTTRSLPTTEQKNTDGNAAKSKQWYYRRHQHRN